MRLVCESQLGTQVGARASQHIACDAVFSFQSSRLSPTAIGVIWEVQGGDKWPSFIFYKNRYIF